MSLPNLFQKLPTHASDEFTEAIVSAKGLQIERIHSNGHVTPSDQWYDQQQNEWVLIVRGSGTLRFEDDTQVTLNPGDHLLIPAHKKHQVIHTAPDTLWLAVHYQ